MTATKTNDLQDFESASVELCQTPEELVQSPLFVKALAKNLEPADVAYINAIIAKRLAGKELVTREKNYLNGLQQDDVLLKKFNEIINTIEYISKKRGGQMTNKQNLPHFDDTGKADSKKVIAWITGEGEKTDKKEFKESPRKALEQERKTAAIAELDRLGMKTETNVAKINAIQFLDDKILIGKTPRAYENMKGGEGTFKQETNQHYYNFAERKAEAKKQGIILPEKKDFVDTLKALPGEYSESNWYQLGNILSIILGESRTGYCDSDGFLNDSGEYGYLGSVSEYNKVNARYFTFDASKGTLNGYYKNYRFVCRPLVKNS